MCSSGARPANCLLCQRFPSQRSTVSGTDDWFLKVEFTGIGLDFWHSFQGEEASQVTTHASRPKTILGSNLMGVGLTGEPMVGQLARNSAFQEGKRHQNNDKCLSCFLVLCPLFLVPVRLHAQRLNPQPVQTGGIQGLTESTESCSSPLKPRVKPRVTGRGAPGAAA